MKASLFFSVASMAAAFLLAGGSLQAQNELIPPGSAPVPAVTSEVPEVPTEPVPQDPVEAVPQAPVKKEPPAVSAADLQALYSRNAELLALQKKMLDRLSVLEEQVRQVRIRAARN